jgi:hypothetical protein
MRRFDQKYKFSNKNDMVCAWRNFKNIFSRPLFTIIFRPKILFFITYSILIGQTKVEFVIYWVLNSFRILVGKVFKFLLHRGKLLRQLFEILYIAKIEKRIVSAECICGNTVSILDLQN